MNYKQKLVDDYANIGERVKYIKKCLEKYGSHLNAYKGGMPVGFLAAIGQMESNCSMNVGGDSTLNEVGMFQITKSTTNALGVPSSIRNSAAGNIWCAGVEYNLKAAELKADYPDLVVLGTDDNWKLARLAFAIGYGGTKSLIERSSPKTGAVFSSVLKHVDKSPISLGRQSAEKVWYRTQMVHLTYSAGLSVQDDSPGLPQKIPGFGGRSYRIPERVLPYLSEPSSFGVGIAAIAAAALLLG